MPIGARKDPFDELGRKLEAANLALATFRSQNQRVFTRADELQEAIGVVHTEMQNLVRKTYATKPSGQYKIYGGVAYNVIVTAKKKRIVNMDSMLPLTIEHPALKAAIKTVCDLAVLDSLLEKELITADLIEQFVTRESMTPALSVKKVEAT